MCICLFQLHLHKICKKKKKTVLERDGFLCLLPWRWGAKTDLRTDEYLSWSMRRDLTHNYAFQLLQANGGKEKQ